MPGGRPVSAAPLTDDELQQIAATYAKTKSINATADALGLDRMAMKRAVEKAGYEWEQICFLQKKGNPTRRLPSATEETS